MILDTTTEPGARCSTRPRERFDENLLTVVPILRSGTLARQFCRRRAHAEIAAVFERSLYLCFNDTFVCLGEPAIGSGPLTLIAGFAPGDKLSHLGLRPGQSVWISDQGIVIGNSVQFVLDRCELWYPPPWPSRPTDRALQEIVGTLTSVIAADAPAEGLARASCPDLRDTAETKLTRSARKRIACFTLWLDDALEPDQVSPAAPSEIIAGLIGLGPGLTPSGDDFLVGALAILDALVERKAHAALADAIAAAPHGLTSPLSDCLLRAAAAGHVGEHLHCAISALMSGRSDRAIAAIRNIGHSSGWDMLAGIVTSLRVVAVRALCSR
jgi:uncharacterized protein DUF2877